MRNVEQLIRVLCKEVRSIPRIGDIFEVEETCGEYESHLVEESPKHYSNTDD